MILRYLKHVLIGAPMVLDELGNVVLLDGNPRITISAHCGSQILAGEPCWFCRAVCWVLGKLFPGLDPRKTLLRRPLFSPSRL